MGVDKVMQAKSVAKLNVIGFVAAILYGLFKYVFKAGDFLLGWLTKIPLLGSFFSAFGTVLCFLINGILLIAVGAMIFVDIVYALKFLKFSAKKLKIKDQLKFTKKVTSSSIKDLAHATPRRSRNSDGSVVSDSKNIEKNTVVEHLDTFGG